MPKQYENSFQHLIDLLKLLDVKLSLSVHTARHPDKSNDEFKGLYISDDEIDAILNDGVTSTNPEDDAERVLRKKVQDLEQNIKDGEGASGKAGITLAFLSLMDRFGLNSLEAEILLFCIALEMDGKYEKLYAYLHDDMTRKRPTIGLIQNVLCKSMEEKAEAYTCFDRQGTLFKDRLIRFCDGRNEGSLLSRQLEVNREIVAFLLGFDRHCREDGNGASKNLLSSDADENFFSEGVRERALNFLKQLGNGRGNATILLQGPWGSGKKQIAESICRDLSIPILPLDLQIFVNRDDGLENALSDLFLRAKIWQSAVYLQNFDALRPGEESEAKHITQILEAIKNFKGLVFLASKSSVNLDGSLNTGLNGSMLELEISVPGYELRKKIWDSYLGEALAKESDQLANKFKFTPGQIRRARAAAESLAFSEGRSSIKREDIYEGCRYQSGRGLSSLAVKIDPNYTFQDMVLPKDKLQQLKDIGSHIKYRGLVYGEWGFGRKLSLGKGLNILFLGPSGTGKTMAAEAIASDLQLDLYKIDLSSVVSKYIGETEKNLSKIFKEAETSDAILFFDEADALFGKRSEVRDSHDRYANIEVSYLLQKMEVHEGIVIMASNLNSSIDDAFLRRIQFTVEFPFPEEELRLRIWKSLLPREAPVAEDLDFEFLARKLNVSGGSIRNIIINAAFQAAESSPTIEMKHIVKAARREFQKTGKVCSQSDFGKYYDVAFYD